VASHFFIVGAQRCGTSLLHRLLSRHPEVEMATPLRPEPKFFLRDELYARGLAHYEETFFAGKPGARLRGEKTVSYLESPLAARRIAQHFPDAPIVILLRDPVDRAVSHYNFSVENGVETLGIEAAFGRGLDRVLPEALKGLSMSPWAYLPRGRYAQHVACYAEHFPRTVVLLLYEELTRGPERFAWLCRRLGVSDDVGTDPVPKAPEDAETRQADLPESRRRELAAYFAESNRELATRYGLDLSSWRSAR